jgi:hypothetical protein
MSVPRPALGLGPQPALGVVPGPRMRSAAREARALMTQPGVCQPAHGHVPDVREGARSTRAEKDRAALVDAARDASSFDARSAAPSSHLKDDAQPCPSP